MEVPGVIRIPYALLAQVGLPHGVLRKSLCLRRGDVHWAFAVLGETDGEFGVGDTIDFLAPPFDHRRVDSDVYWLQFPVAQ